MPILKAPKGIPSSLRSELAASRTGFRPIVCDGRGTSYTGDWLNNKRHGRGKAYWQEGKFVYDGDWKDDIMCGKGKLFQYDPQQGDYVCIYTGDWVSSQRNGFGTHNYSAVSVYEGEWQNDLRHGHGKMVYESGDIYEGQWHQDTPHGRGSKTYADNSLYIGSWLNGSRCGEGCYETSDGVYCGSWKNDMKNGPGRYTYPSGSVLTGVWLNNVFKCGTFVEEKAEKLPVCTLVDSDGVVDEATKLFLKKIEDMSILDNEESKDEN